MAAAFSNGTRKFFNMSVAPTGWTRDVTAYNHAILITGVGNYTSSTGGVSDFTTVHPSTTMSASASGTFFGSTTSDSALDIPSHTHTGTASARTTSPFGTTQAGYTVPSTNPRTVPYWRFVSAQSAQSFSEPDWSDAWPTGSISMGSLVVGTTYSIAALGTTTAAQWSTVSGGSISASSTNIAIGDTFVAATNGSGLGTGQVRAQIPGGTHNHNTSVTGTFTNSGSTSFNLGVKYVDLMLTIKNGIYGATWASQTTTTMTKGSSVSFTWNTPTTTIPVSSTIYYTIQNTGYTGALSSTLRSGSFVTTGTTFTQSITITDNGVWDRGGSFMIQIRSDSIEGAIMARSQVVTITEPNPTATFTLVPTTINEGTSGSFTFTTTRLKNGEVLTYAVNNTTASNADFSSVTGSVIVSSNTGTFTITPTIDLLVESAETFTVSLKTSSGLTLATSSSVSIIDVPPTVTFTVTPTTINAYTAGTFTITTTNVPNGTPLTWSINLILPTELSNFVNTSGTVYIYNNTGTFYINSNVAHVATTRTFTVAVKNSTGQTINTSPVVSLTSTPVSFETPIITSLNEGQTVSYTINTTNLINGSKLLWKILPFATTPTSAENFNNISGYVTVNDNKGEFSITSVANSSTVGTKRFMVDIYDLSGTYSLTATLGHNTYFDGSTNSLTTASGLSPIASFLPSTGAFTFEGFFYITREMATGPTKIIAGGNAELNIDNATPGQVRFDLPKGQVNVLNSGTTVLQPNIWYHIALTRTIGNLFTLYINGVSVGSGSSSTSITSTTNLGATGQTKPFQGYMYNVRATNALVYTGNFTVPTGLLGTTQNAGTNISAIAAGEVQLLTFQNNYVSDNSGMKSLSWAGTLSTLNVSLPIISLLDVFAAGSIYKFITPKISIREGLAATLQFESNVSSGTLYWTINNISTSNADFTGSIVSGTVTLNGSTVIDSTALNQRYLQTFTITTSALDVITESTETFTVSLRTNSITGTVVATSEIITINNYK